MYRIAVFLLLSAVSANAQKKPDFSGNWELNVEKSNFGKATKPTRMSLKQENRGDYLHATQTTSTADGGQTTTEGDWFLDGKQHPLEQFGPGASVTHWEGNTLVNERRSNDGNYRESTRISMSADGMTATEKLYVKNPNGENRSVLIWERK